MGRFYFFSVYFCYVQDLPDVDVRYEHIKKSHEMGEIYFKIVCPYLNLETMYSDIASV
jgi:hypothetical protein